MTETPAVPTPAASGATTLLKALPHGWRATLATLRGMRVLSGRDIGIIGTLAVITVAFESIGVAMLLPLLQFIQAERDVAALTESSRMWATIATTFGAVGLPIGFLSLAGAILLLIVLRQVFDYINTLTLTRIRGRVGKALSDRCFARVLSSRADYIRGRSSGAFVYLLQTQCQSANALIHSFATLAGIALTFVAYSAVVALNAPLPSILALVAIALAVLSVNRFVNRSRRVNRRLIKAAEGLAHFLGERYRAWRLIKLSDAVPRETARMGAHTAEILDLSVEMADATAKTRLVIAPLLTLLALGSLYVSAEYFNLELAVLTLFIVVLLRMVPVAEGLARLRQSIVVQATNLERVKRIFDETRAMREPKGGEIEFAGVARAIEFDTVTYAYPGGGHAALDGVSVTIPTRSMTAITGPSGAGKSTLVDLIPRLIEPSAGRITVDGTPIADFRLESLRRRVAYASQEPVIFDASVADNVRYARPEASLEEVRSACRMAFADSFIEALDDRYDTRLGEGGVRLSGGQRQRLVLARTFLARASILILDEPTSALDHESEAKVREALETVTAQGLMTVIVIAHRLSTIRSADHVVVMRDGRVVEQGSPNALGKTHGWFHDMVLFGEPQAETAEAGR